MTVKAKADVTISRIVDIEKVTRYYLLQSSTATKPSKPTVNPPGGSWTITEPSYVSDTTNTLYFTDQTLLTNGTYSYSDVSISSSYEAAKEAWNKANNAQNAADDANQKIDDAASDIHQTIIEQNTALTNTCKEIILEALTTYTETKDFEVFKETVSSQLKLMSDELILKFTESTKQIEGVNSDLQEKFNTITKYFTFDINGLTIGQVDNPYKVIIDNDRYSMTVNGVEVMWIADGKVYTPELEVSSNFRLFNLVIDQDGSGNVNVGYMEDGD